VSGAGARIAIVGGGFTGAAVAFHLVRSGRFALGDVTVFEPRERIGTGLAYDTADPACRINVPASKMSLVSSEMEAFEQWYRDSALMGSDPDALAADGHLYPRRSAFGAHVHGRMAPLVKSGLIRHIRNKVERLVRAGRGWIVMDDQGNSHKVDIVVIATSHPAPQAPASLGRLLSGHPRFVADATIADALSAIRPTDHVLIVGNGLTSADVIASLTTSGHRGPVTAFSRRGLVSRGHATRPQEPWGDFTSRPIRSARILVKRVRQAIDDAAAFDVSWHAVLDAVRLQGQVIWSHLPVCERRRLVRHLRPFWDVHRFRIAPQVEDLIRRQEALGRVRRMAASLGPIARQGERIDVSLRKRRGGVEHLAVDAVVVTTGPAHGGILSSTSYLGRLAEDGLVTLDPTGLGLACDLGSRILGADGGVTGSLYVAGPLARGAFGELMGLPQVADHARAMAEEVLGEVFGSTAGANSSTAA
jgi:uncharacterized NAD(P)/FAD-binding protein YdhS